MKTSISSIPALIVFATMCLSSCSGIYYAPNSQNVPMFKEKKEARIAASFGTAVAGDYNVEGLEIQSAYAAGQHFAIIANGFSVHTPKDATDSQAGYLNKVNLNLIELGTGYFKPFSNSRMVFETYGGFGVGNAKNTYEDGSQITAKLTRLFIQPSIGYSTDYFGAAVSGRLAWLNNASLQNSSFSGTINASDMTYLGQNDNSFLIEPAVTFRAGWKGFKFQSQFVWSFNYSHVDFPQAHINFNTGVCLIINAKK